jgi:hypothetical protein
MDTCYEASRRLSVHTAVHCPLYAEARRIFHLDGVVTDILGDNPSWTSEILVFVTAFGLATTI